MGQSLTKDAAVADPDIDLHSSQSSESPIQASQDHGKLPDLEHGGGLDTTEPNEESAPPTALTQSKFDLPQAMLGKQPLTAGWLEALIPGGGVPAKDPTNKYHIMEKKKEMVNVAPDEAANVKDGQLYRKPENPEGAPDGHSSLAKSTAIGGAAEVMQPILLPAVSQTAAASLGQPTTQTPSNGDLSLPFSVLSRKVDEIHAAVFRSSVAKPTTSMQHPTGRPVDSALSTHTNQSTGAPDEPDLLQQAGKRLVQFINATPSRPLSELNTIRDSSAFIVAVLELCGCDKWPCKAAYVLLANVDTELKITKKHLGTVQASHQSMVQHAQQHLTASREELRKSGGKFAATVRALIAAVKENERLQAECELLKVAFEQEGRRSKAYMSSYHFAQKNYNRVQGLYDAEKARHQALLASLGQAAPSCSQYNFTLADQVAQEPPRIPLLGPAALPTPALDTTTSKPAAVDTNQQEVSPYLFVGKHVEETKDKEKAETQTQTQAHAVAATPLALDVQLTAEKEPDGSSDLKLQSTADEGAWLARLQDPDNPEHLKYEIIRLEKDNDEIPKLRSRVKKADLEREELLRLRREVAENGVKAVDHGKVEEAESLLLDYSRVSEALKNMKAENKTLKTDASEAGVTKLKRDLRKSNAQNEELKHIIKAIEDGQMVTRTDINANNAKDHSTTRSQPKTSTTPNSDSDENDPTEAHRFRLHKFQLTTTTTSTSSTYIKESVRLLKYLTKLHKTVFSCPEYQ